jgi:2-polyprenyl-3-methyl-5-hydroxy-6-metoxy-1,4-benzoquinol methylase
VPGLVAAARGRPVVLTDLDPEALEFARAAAELSGLGGRVQVRPLDWKQSPPDLEPFATVLGAEILYHPEVYPALWRLLERVVAPGGRVFLSLQERPFTVGFFAQADGHFRLRGTRRRLRSGDEEVVVQLCLLERQEAAAGGRAS